MRQTVQVCGYLMSFARTLGEGPHYYAWMREFGDPEDERRIMLILNTEPHPGDDDLWLLMEQRWGACNLLPSPKGEAICRPHTHATIFSKGVSPHAHPPQKTIS